jgi:lipid A disaccharide synthetase
MKYYIIAGEVSGDLHGSNLIKESEVSCNSNIIFYVTKNYKTQNNPFKNLFLILSNDTIKK